MKIFTIENETNNITIHATAQEAEAVANAERFRNEAGLAKLAADWPMARFVEIWNSLPGETAVKKFKDRATAVSRIWKSGPDTTVETEAVQPAAETERKTAATVADVAPHAPDVAPAEAPAKKKATRAKKTPTVATNPGAPREGSKTSQVIAMLKREGGTTLEEIMTAMQWQKHTTRAMLSAGGSLTRNHGLTVTSEKVGDQRRYLIKA